MINRIRTWLAEPQKSFFSKQVLAFVSLFPPVRAAILFKRGQVRRPVYLLRLGTFYIPSAVALKRRLEEVLAYLSEGTALEEIDSGGRKCQHGCFNNAVLFVFHSCGYFHPSGYASRSISLLTSLGNSGVRTSSLVRLGYPWDISRVKVSLDISKVEYSGHVFHLREDRRYNLGAPESEYIVKYAGWIAERARATDASILHASSNYLNGLAAARAGEQCGIRTVYELRGLWHITRAFYDPFYAGSEHYRYVEKRELEACLSVDRVVTLSLAMKDWLVARGVPEGKVSVVGNATHEPEIVGEAEARKKVRAQYGIPEGDLVIGYLGSLVTYEGLDLLLTGLQQVPELERPFILFIGGGKAEANLRSLAVRLGVADRVVFGGRVSADQVSSHYMAMDLVALPRKDHALTRLVPAIKPYEVVGHGRRLLISPALASAIVGSLDHESYEVVDFESPQWLKLLLKETHSSKRISHVPTWDDRAAQLTKLYNAMF